MCGIKPCKKCSAKKRTRISGTAKKRKMARRKNYTKGIAGAAKDVGVLLVGGLLASQLDRVNFVSSNPLLGGAIKFAVGAMVLPKVIKGPMGAGLGMGVAYQGGKEIVNAISPGMISGFDSASFLSPAGSTSVSAVAGKTIVLD